MTPYEIYILLWYYARVEDHPDLARTPPIWTPTIDAFLQLGVLKRALPPDYPAVQYQLTPRGHAYIDSLRRIPLPEQTWFTTYPSAGG